ncbi:MAG: hypothetical protein ACXV7F_13205 [Methylomonas sp.]
MYFWQRNFFLIALCIISCACAAQPTSLHFEAHTDGANSKTLDRPKLNPTPHALLVIQGHKDPDLEIWFSMTYATTNPACKNQTIINRIAGAPEVTQSVQDFVRAAGGQSNFSLHLYLDRYLPGRCGWEPLVVLHGEFEQGRADAPRSFAGVVAIRTEGVRNMAIHWDCQRTIDSYHKPPEDRIFCVSKSNFSDTNRPISMNGGVLDLTFSFAK